MHTYYVFPKANIGFSTKRRKPVLIAIHDCKMMIIIIKKINKNIVPLLSFLTCFRTSDDTLNLKIEHFVHSVDY